MQTTSHSLKLAVEPRENYVTFNDRQVLVFDKARAPWLWLLRRTVFQAMLNIEDGIWVSCLYLPNGRLWKILGKRVKEPKYNLKRKLSKALKVVK